MKEEDWDWYKDPIRDVTLNKCQRRAWHAGVVLCVLFSFIYWSPFIFAVLYWYSMPSLVDMVKTGAETMRNSLAYTYISGTRGADSYYELFGIGMIGLFIVEAGSENDSIHLPLKVIYSLLTVLSCLLVPDCIAIKDNFYSEAKELCIGVFRLALILISFIYWGMYFLRIRLPEYRRIKLRQISLISYMVFFVFSKLFLKGIFRIIYFRYGR